MDGIGQLYHFCGKLYIWGYHKLVHRKKNHFTQLLYKTTEKIQNHLKTYNFSYPF